MIEENVLVVQVGVGLGDEPTEAALASLVNVSTCGRTKVGTRRPSGSMQLETGLQGGELAEVPRRQALVDEAPWLPPQQHRRQRAGTGSVGDDGKWRSAESCHRLGNTEVRVVAEGAEPCQLRSNRFWCVTVGAMDPQHERRPVGVYSERRVVLVAQQAQGCAIDAELGKCLPASLPQPGKVLAPTRRSVGIHRASITR